MPYIQSTDRTSILAGRLPNTCGELNFLLTMLGLRHAGRDSELITLWQQAADRYVETKGLSYQTINDIIGAFTGAGLEFRRRMSRPSMCEDGRILKALLDATADEFYTRVAAPYETEKMKINGDLPFE